MCCDVDARIIDSRVEQREGQTIDILVYQCPVCKRTWEREIPRE